MFFNFKTSIKFTTFVLAGMLASSAAFGQDRPVTIGQDGWDMDACGASGVVHNLKPGGDNFLSVRSGPSSKSTEIDRLVSNQLVYLCETRGRWIGIVYPPLNNPDIDCGTGSAIPNPETYRGPCRSGWAFDKFILLMAG